jgi:hypothetical protein
MRVDDNDAALCQHNREISFGWFMSVVIAIPTLLALSHESVQQGIMDIIFPTLWCCFLLGNAYLFSISPALFALPYTLLAMYMAYRYCYLLPHRRRETVTGVDGYHSEYDHQLAWRNMNQSLALVDQGCASAASRLAAGGKATRGGSFRRQSSGRPHALHFMSMESIPQVSSEDESDMDSSSDNSISGTRGDMRGGLSIGGLGDASFRFKHDSKRTSIQYVPAEIIDMQRRMSLQLIRKKDKHKDKVWSVLANKYMWGTVNPPESLTRSNVRLSRRHTVDDTTPNKEIVAKESHQGKGFRSLNTM